MARADLEPEIARLVDEVAEMGPAAVAAFDADGTVWAGDIGEELLLDLAGNGRLVHPPEGSAFTIYEELFAQDPPRAFCFCIEAMRAVAVADVERWSDDLFTSRFAHRVFPGVSWALQRLRDARVSVYLVSASGAVTVRRAAARLGLDPALVLAVEGKIVDGRFTGEVLPPVTTGPGKVEAIKPRLGGRPRELAFGNSLFDRDMLALSRRAVMVAPRNTGGPAVDLARASCWPIHRVG